MSGQSDAPNELNAIPELLLSDILTVLQSIDLKLTPLQSIDAKLDALQSLAPIAHKLTNGPLGKLFGGK